MGVFRYLTTTRSDGAEILDREGQPYPVQPGAAVGLVTTQVGPPSLGLASFKAMLCGDSLTAGGAASMDDTAAAWRLWFWQRIRKHRGKIALLGDQLFGIFDNRPGLGTANPPGDAILGDWHCAATGGYTLAQINAEASLVELQQGPADVYCLMGGENDVTTGATVAQVLAGVQTFLKARLAANPNAIIVVGDMEPIGPQLAGYNGFNTTIGQVNAGLPAAVAAVAPQNAFVAAVGSLLGPGYAQLGPSGNHAAGPSGYALMGNAFADAVLSRVGIGGAPFPRKVTQRLPVARLFIGAGGNSDAYVADNGTASVIPLGKSSFSMGVLINPGATLPAAQQCVLQCGNDVTPVGTFNAASGCFLLAGPAYAGAPNGGACLQLYLNGVAQYQANDALRTNTWHAVVVSVTNNIAAGYGEFSIFCLRAGPDGLPCTSLMSTVRGPVYTAPTPAHFGILHTVIAGLIGARGDMWIASGTAVTVDQVEDWFCDGVIPAGVTAWYPMNENGGAVLNPSSGDAGVLPLGVANNITWLAPGAIVEPWHRYISSSPVAPPQAGIWTLPLTFVGGTFVVNDSQIASENGLAWSQAKILYAASALTSNLIVTLPVITGREVIIDNSTSGAFTMTVNGLAVAQGTRVRAYFNPLGTLVTA